MQRKLQLILLAVAILAVVSGYYFFTSLQQGINITNNQQEGKKEFSDFATQKKKLPQKSEEVSLVAVGDISYSRGVEQIVDKQKDINYPFLKVKDYLQNSDLTFGNLETPITQGQKILDFEMVFRSNPGTEQALKNAGFSVLSLANNHTPNFGEKGLEDTFNYLDSVGIKYVGVGKNSKEANQPIYVEANGIKFAFLAYNDADVVPSNYEASENRAGTAFMRIDKMTVAVKEAKQKADFVILSMHSGTEYADKPNDSQINFAHVAIDAGADLIIGHHPHVVQTMEEYKGKYIFYSLGNFVFDQMQSQQTKQGLAIKVYFSKEEIDKILLMPIVMKNFAQPELANDSDSENILKRLNSNLQNSSVYYWNNDFIENQRYIIYAKNYENNAIVSKTETADLDNDSIKESYSLENGQLTITENSKILWQSPSDWWIDDFVLADSNNDGVMDLNMSLWKSGDFGTSKPFWIKENDMSVKNHFFVYDLAAGKIKPVWGSSNLTAPNCEFKIADVNGNGENELIAFEGDYADKPLCKGNYVAVWKWNGWGFSNDWRSEKGSFYNMEIERNDNKVYIVTENN